MAKADQLSFELSYEVRDEAATVALGRQLANVIGLQGLCIYLLGDLGAGKTTLSRGIIQAFGHVGAVKSPTYTLVEPYEIAIDKGKLRKIYHFDLYRLADPAELEFLGLDDYFTESSLCLIEWPARGRGFIPKADIELTLTDADLTSEQGSVVGRQLHCQSLSLAGEQVLKRLQVDSDSVAVDMDETAAGQTAENASNTRRKN